jgi:hypothetical protein
MIQKLIFVHNTHTKIDMQNMLFFYSPLLIQLYWITYYVESLIGGSDHSSNGLVMSLARCYYYLSSNGHGDALWPITTMIHQNPGRDKHIYRHHTSKVGIKN